MKTSNGKMPDTSDQFAQIMQALKVESSTHDFGAAHELCAQLVAETESLHRASDLRVQLAAEEALVWRILLFRMLRELGAESIFQSRTKGAATGTASVHPAVEAIAKTYERLRNTMDEFTPATPSTEATSATGLPMRMLRMLEDSDGALEEVLGVGPGEASPFTPKLVKRPDRGMDNGA